MNATFPQETLQLTDSEVRGYSWITVVSPGVLDRLGGVEAVRAGDSFYEVARPPSGGAILQATERLSGYDANAVRNVFEALAPVLPSKAPWPDEFDRFKLIYQSPASRSLPD
jgi:hypothetical protein